MAAGTAAPHEHWSGRLTFILAAVGSAVGLGNFWRFPYTVGESGGGAFVIIYLVCAFALILPILIAELAIGRRAQRDAPGSFSSLARESGGTGLWGLAGVWGVVAGVLILSFYCVIGGWVILYIPDAFMGAFADAGMRAQPDGPTNAETLLGALFADPVRMAVGQAVFLLLTVLIVARGVAKGIETAVEILMPVLFLMLVGLVIYGAIEGDFAATLDFLFVPHFEDVTPQVVVAAIGQAFFSVGVGIGLMITYGSYVERDVKLAPAAVTIVFADTAVALLAGLAIFPFVFASGLGPGAGPGLMFVSLPIALSTVPFAEIVTGAFFILLFVAAVTSSISILELALAWLMRVTGMSRPVTAAVLGISTFVLGLGTVLSFNLWADYHPLAAIPTFEGKTVFDSLDHLTQTFMLPIGGLMIALFAAFAVNRSLMREELPELSDGMFAAWRFVTGIIVPVAIVAIVASLLAG